MIDTLNPLISALQEFVVTAGYAGVLFAAFLENFFPPLPSELIFPFVGFVAARGELSIWGVILAGTAGALLGAAFWYGLGFILGRANLKVYVDRYGKYLKIKFTDIEKAEKWFEKYEGPAVFFGRLIPLVRTFISVPAGFVGMNKARFGAYTFLGSFLWIGFLTFGGFFLGERWEQVAEIVDRYEAFAYLVIAITLVFLIVRFYRRKH